MPYLQENSITLGFVCAFSLWRSPSNVDDPSDVSWQKATAFNNSSTSIFQMSVTVWKWVREEKCLFLIIMRTNTGSTVFYMRWVTYWAQLIARTLLSWHTKHKAAHAAFGDQANTFSEGFLKESFQKQEDSNTIWVSCTLREKKHLNDGNGSVYQGG